MYKDYLTMYIVQLHNNIKLAYNINFVTVTWNVHLFQPILTAQASRYQLMLKDRTRYKPKSIVTIFVSQNNVNTCLPNV